MARAFGNAPAKAALGDTRQRISALALIYRTLYQSNDIRHADAREFLNELVGQLVASEAGRGPVVISSVDADSLHVDPDKLAPLALWLVEAVTNAQKHAFAGSGGELKVRFRVQGEKSVLEVEDNGPGAQAGAEVGVGRTLMSAFVALVLIVILISLFTQTHHVRGVLIGGQNHLPSRGYQEG
mgnify:CR=1 FL=1